MNFSKGTDLSLPPRLPPLIYLPAQGKVTLKDVPLLRQVQSGGSQPLPLNTHQNEYFLDPRRFLVFQFIL